MTGEDALKLIESLLQEAPLSKLQAIVLKQTWEDKSYLEIARDSGYEVGYVRQAGSQLCQLLSRTLGQRVSKSNLRFLLQRYARQTQLLQSEAHAWRSPHSSPGGDLQIDWGEATDVSVFYGRTAELDLLAAWIVQDRCRLVGLFGMGGIGKTCLSVKLATQIQAQFDFLVWRSLRNAPPINALLADLVQFLSQQQETALPNDLDSRMLRLLHYLRQQRCLLILDNSETIMQEGDRDGNYLPGYEGYGQLLRYVGETSHQSCLLLTSREKPRGFAAKEGDILPVRSLQLAGLESQAGQQLLALKGEFTGTPQDWQTLINHYAGNPLALKMVAPAIQDFFEGDVARFLEFLDQGPTVFGDIRGLLAQQLARLSDLEDQVITWLAINREFLTLAELRSDFLPPIPPGELLEALTSLERRCMLERAVRSLPTDRYQALFTLQPVVMEYITERLIDRTWEELTACGQQGTLAPLKYLKTHALLKAQAKDYLHEIQRRLILQPLLTRLSTQSPDQLAQRLQAILHQLQEQAPRSANYVAGNLVNLLAQLPVDLTGSNFSHLAIWQADLSQVNLQRVRFTQADLSRSVFKETFSQVLSVAFSPDGRLLAASDVSHEIRIWQVLDGKQVFHQQVEDGWVWSVAFSPDGQTLASSANRAVKLWDVQTGNCRQVFQGYTGRIFSLSFSPDGKYLATGSEDQLVSIWDLQAGTLAQVLTGHTHEVRSVAFAPMRQSGPEPYLLASGSGDRTIRLWTQTQAGWNCLGVLEGHQDWVWSVAFSPDGKTLASGSGDRTIKLWGTTIPLTAYCLATLTGHSQRIRTVAFSGNGRTLASGGDDQMVYLWDWQTQECLRRLQGHSSWIAAVAFAPVTTALPGLGTCLLASGSEDQSVRLWDGQTSRCLRTLQGHSNGIWSVTFSPRGDLLASGGQDRLVHLWQVRTGQHLSSWSGHSNWVWSVAFNPDGSLLASGSEDRTIRVWQGATGTCVHLLQGHQNAVLSVAFSPDGGLLASGSLDGTVKLWSITTGACLATLEGHQSGVWTVAFSPDGQAIASGSQDKTIKIWRRNWPQLAELQPGLVLQDCQTLTQHSSWIRCVAFTPQTQTLRLVSGSSDGVVKLWDGQTGACVRTIAAHASPVLATIFSPAAQVLVTSGADATIYLWNAETGDCLQSLVGHEKWVRFLSYSPDGRYLASCSQDETIRLWDPVTGTCLALLRLPRPYEGMEITATTGLTPAQKVTLKALGAIEQSDTSPNPLPSEFV